MSAAAATTAAAGAKCAADIAALLRARNPLIWLVTREEARAERVLIEATASAVYDVAMWDCATGLTRGDGQAIDSRCTDPAQALAAIRDRTERCVYVLRDLPPWLRDPTVVRAVRSLCRDLPSKPRDQARAMIVVTPSAEVPPELQGHAIVVDLPLPDRAEIAALLDAAVRALPEDVRDSAAPNGTRDAAIDAAVGLTAEEAQSTFARSLITARRIDPAAVASEKRRVISRERVLEWFDPHPAGLAAVGGLEVLKGWLMQRRAAFSAKARAYGLPAPKGVMLVGVPGCLAAGTRVAYLRGKRVSAAGRSLPIEVFCAKFNGQASSSRPWTADVPTYLQSWNSQTGALVYNEVTAVMPTGYKPCVRVRTECGSEVECTSDHPILLADGTWAQAQELQAGHSSILVRGSMLPQASGQPRTHRKRVVIDGLRYHPIAWRKVVIDGDKRYEYQRTTRARLVIEARMNGMDLESFIETLKSDEARAATLAYLPSEYDVHHADEDSMNDDPGNLVVVPHDEHARLHGADAAANFGTQYTRAALVASIEPIGIRQTFDITMAEPLPNFVVNGGAIVHNCGKSLSAKAVATAWGMPLLRLDMGALRSKWVGESEGNIRKALKVAETVAPCVLWLDEIEKALAGATQGAADGGTSADALGAVLQWMQDRAGDVFVVATANDVSALPPELLRKGRFDEVFFVDLPNATEREAILRAALTAHGIGPEGIDLAPIAAATREFTGAELAALVPDAMFAAFADDARPVFTADLQQAAERTVPLAKTASERITAIRQWAVGRARNASAAESTATTTSAPRALDL
jgi:hypothetical protein